MAALVDLSQDIKELRPHIIELRRKLHQHPELAFEEVWTAATLAGRMQALGLAVEEGIGGTGVLALLEGAKPGKTLLIRSDIDALPMEETTGREYASKIPNRNHSCGHDAHAAVVSGVAELLLHHRERIAGRVAFVFQPADEPMRGAKRMIEDGLFERIKPDFSLSLHVLPMAKIGQVVVQSGPIWASWDTCILNIMGPAPALGGQNAFDIARIAARVTMALYELIEREGQSRDPVFFRVRSIVAEQRAQGEPSHAAIQVHLGYGQPSHAALEINLALYDNVLRAHLLKRISEVAGAIVGVAGGTFAADVDYQLPALINDEHVTRAVELAAQRVIGAASIIKNWRNRFADDFVLFMDTAPGCMMLLGTANPEKGITEAWHRPGFDIDEDSLPIAVEIMSLAALDLLQPNSLLRQRG